MVPNTSLSILYFLGLVTPGLVFDLLWETRRTRPNETAFREISRVVLASFVLTAAALLTLVVVNVGVVALPGTWRVLPNAGEWILKGNGYLASHVALVAGSVMLQAAFASALAWLAFRLLTRNEPVRLSQVSAWHQAFRARNPSTAAPRARVRLKSGATFVGLIGDYTAGLAPMAERELVLYPPLYSKRTEAELSPMPADWHCIVISGSEVETIALRYRAPHPGDPEMWNTHR